MSRFDGHIRALGPMPGRAVAALTQRLDANPDVWVSRDARFQTALEDVQNVVLRFPADYPQSHLHAANTRMWDVLGVRVPEIVEALARPYGYSAYDTGKVVLSKLRPGGTIPEHVDLNPSSVTPHKIHVPLATHPDALFLIEGTAYHLEAGNGYEVNNLLPHAVRNHSAFDRIHLIIELYPTA